MTYSDTPLAATASSAYDAALQHVAQLDAASIGRVWLHGPDRAALLQRLTTNDLLRLRPGDGTRTILVNIHARILDVITVYALPNAMILTTQVGQGSTLARFLHSKIFFQDKVTVEDRSDTTVHIGLVGPQAAALLEPGIGGATDWPLHRVSSTSINDIPVWVSRMLPLGSDSWGVIADRAASPMLQQAFAEALPLDTATHDLLRIEAGHGAARREWSTDYIPLEAGLGDAISFTKGCYVGQEIIARMDSRNRLAKRLMGVRVDHQIAPQPLLADDKDAGLITSMAHSPRYGWIGLGYIRTAFAAEDTMLSTANGDHVHVVELPFGTTHNPQ